MSPASLASLQPTLSEGSSDQRTHSSIRCHKWLLIFSNAKEDPSLSNSHNLLFWVVFWYFDKCIVAERKKRSCLPSIQYSSSGLTTLTSPVPDLVRISVSCLVFLIRWEHGVQNTYLLLKKSKKKTFLLPCQSARQRWKSFYLLFTSQRLYQTRDIHCQQSDDGRHIRHNIQNPSSYIKHTSLFCLSPTLITHKQQEKIQINT